MNDEKLKKQIGLNIAAYRKRSRLTQAGMAEKLNYSDKAVSKWERGDSIPDVLTLVQIAELFEISVNDLLIDPDQLPEQTGPVERVVGRAVEKTLKRKADKRVILSLCSLLVWFVALFVFVVVSQLNIPNSWAAFVYAVPVDAIVRLSLRSAWRDFRRNQILVSAIVWGGIISVYMTLLLFWDVNMWKLFLLGIPGQAAIFLWFRLFHKVPKETENG